ncbi:MAG TPA: hypothetical protein VEL05_13125 [Candidatus Acidoferrum sp.]|nr:hypothetical protein [Candidatus Acidoferrum sp.]
MSARSSTRTECVAAAVLAALACACDKSAGSASGEGSRSPPAVRIAISIDWEGAYFLPPSLAALDQFRKDNPGVPVTHMLNAAYYTKPGADRAEATRTIRRAVLEGDELGLHIHAWKSLLAAAGVAPRDGPSFLSRTGGLMRFEDDIGFDVDLAVFSVGEMRAVMAKSREILAAEKLAPGTSFRAGAWLATTNVLEAARAEGFTVDSSATDPAWFDEEEVPVLRQRLRELWSRIDRTTQPFWIETRDGRILEMPDTGAMADYLTVLEIQEHVERAAASLAKAGDRPVFVHLGFHAETADEFAPRLSQALSVLRARNTPMRFETLSRSADAARRALER